jgi:glycine cleavage system T protein (aminomethyltransferase)
MANTHQRPRDFDLIIRNPLAQSTPVWATMSAADLPSAQKVLGLRRTDPGRLFAISEQILGPADEWCILGANVIGVMGWPAVSLENQYRAVTQGAGAFIASGMCYLRLSGKDAADVLDMLSPRKISDLPVGSARFTLFTTPAGTVDEEAVIVRTAPDEFLMSCGGGKHPGWLATVARRFSDVAVTPSEIFSFNIKGPCRLEAAQSLMHPGDAGNIAALRNFRHCVTSPLVGGTARVLKTVIGYEIWATADTLAAVWQQLLTERPKIVPCAWELLTVYRLECTPIVFALYPLDIHSGTTLWDVGYGRMIRRDEGDYIGRKALLESADRARLWFAGLRAAGDTPAPVAGEEVLAPSGDFLGHVTSAAYSPLHGRTLAFAHLLPPSAPGKEVMVNGETWTTTTLPIADATQQPSMTSLPGASVG